MAIILCKTRCKGSMHVWFGISVHYDSTINGIPCKVISETDYVSMCDCTPEEGILAKTLYIMYSCLSIFCSSVH